MASGTVISETYKRHRHQEVLRFLRKVVRTVPKKQEIHIILDNDSPHKHAKVMERKKRIFLHFIPTSSLWLNLVERFFSMLTEKRLRRGVFTSVADLEQCIDTYIKTYNENPRPLVGTKSVDEILRKVERAKRTLKESPG